MKSFFRQIPQPSLHPTNTVMAVTFWRSRLRNPPPNTLPFQAKVLTAAALLACGLQVDNGRLLKTPSWM